MSNQMSLFDGQHKLKIDKPIRLIELFAGIGAQAKALERLGVQFEHYRICEFDKYAVTSYNAIHGTYFKTSDICKIKAEDLGVVDTDKYCYIMTYSFPCTDLSVAGKQAGMSKGTGTRSGLLWEVERLLREMKELPQILLMENVPQVIGQKNIKDFADWISFLDGLGYKSKWEVLNAKDFNVPQNRERCFMVSWQGDYYYEFPKTIGFRRLLQDVLEKDVDKKYYLPQTLIDYYIKRNDEQRKKKNGFFFEPNDGSKIAKSILTRPGSRQCDNFILQLPRGYNIGGIKSADFCPSITTSCFQHNNFVGFSDYKIRRLTERECFRLMDFDDQDYDSVRAAGVSSTRIYNQAGNSIVVAVLEAIFKQML